jgi:hypothetical protein
MLKAPSTLLLGPTGTGKTSSLITYPAADIDLFAIITEPSGIDSLLDSAVRLKVPIDKIHWATVSPVPPDLDVFKKMTGAIASMGFEQLQLIKSGIGKDQTRDPADKLLSVLADFVDERTGESYGSPFTWDDDRALALDSLSGLNTISMDLTVGFKPSAHQGEWGVAMNFEEKLLLKLTADLRCYFTLTAHVDKELNEVTGIRQIMAAALGRKLAPRIARFFNEIVYCVKDKGKFTWSTIEEGVDLKNRALALADNLPPDFGQIVSVHNQRKEQLQQSDPSSLPKLLTKPTATKRK